MKTNLRERLTRYHCVIRPKVHFAPELSFKVIKTAPCKMTISLKVIIHGLLCEN